MRLHYAILAMLLCGCAKVNAQNSGATISGTGAGWIQAGDLCTEADGREGHWRDQSPNADYILGCEMDDGKPPRWVEYTVECHELDCGMSPPVKSHRWECDKGYKLDGFDVTWPDGAAKISPARCKAAQP